ncbi:MAG: hypothetical protein PHW73_10725 [Atribacterota bacterium]|nr:hypothetical protein [Atribacterota bacterium]
MENKDLDKEFLDLIKGRLAYSFQSSDNLDSKAATILGFGGIIFSLLLSIVFSNKEIIDIVFNLKLFSFSFKTIFFVGMIPVLLGIFFEILAIRSKKFFTTPNIIKIYEKLKSVNEKNKESITEVKLEKLIKSYKHNIEINKNKARNIDRGLLCIILGLLINLVLLFFYFYF